MTGVKVDITSDVAARLAQLEQQLQHPAPLFARINEYMMRSTRARFKTQTGPDGAAWEPLSARYLKRKHKNKDKILTLRGYLQGTLRGQFDDSGLVFGTNVQYASIHQFGGIIKRSGGEKDLYFRQNKDGSIGNRFVKKKKSNFVQTVSVSDYEFDMPARPFLGLSDDDRQFIARLAIRYLNNTAPAQNAL